MKARRRRRCIRQYCDFHFGHSTTLSGKKASADHGGGTSELFALHCAAPGVSRFARERDARVFKREQSSGGMGNKVDGLLPMANYTFGVILDRGMVSDGFNQ